jgi:hypothetical protein
MIQIDVNKISRQLWSKPMDDQTFDRLFQVSKTHVKLAKEHGSKGTTFERRQEIIKEVGRLRIERDSLINNTTLKF